MALAPIPGVVVRVSDARGRPVPGALVEQVRPIPSDARADATTPRAERVFSRTFETESDGTVVVDTWRGPMLLRAESGQSSSLPWIGSPRASIDLSLASTCVARGRAVAVPGALLEGSQRVSCFALRGASRDLLATVDVVDGHWGPARLPLPDGPTSSETFDGFLFRLEGWNARIREEVRGLPAAGQELVVDFELEEGQDLWFQVIDELTQEVLSDAEVTVSWSEDGGAPLRATGYQEGQHVLVRGTGSGTATYTASAPGHASRTIGPYRIPEEEAVVNQVSLATGGSLGGRVTHKGQPVKDFEVACWDKSDPLEITRHTFRNREDGRFQIDRIPLGLAAVVASAPGTGPSQVDTVAVAAEVRGETLLELAVLVRGSGLVVDAATGEPVSSARIQPFVHEDQRARTSYGAAIEVASDGEFDDVAFQPGRSRVRVAAPGYATAWAEAFAESGQAADFGTIALARRRSLSIVLVSDTPFDGTEFEAWASGHELLPKQRFDADGRAVFADVGPGVYHIRVRRGAGPAVDATVVLSPGEDWTVEIPVAGEDRLRVEVVPTPTEPQSLWVFAELPLPGGRRINQGQQLGSDGTAEFRGLMPGGFTVHVHEGVDGGRLGSTGGILGVDDRLTVARVTLTEGTELLVVDASGSPVGGARVSFTPAQPGLPTGGVITDSSGRGLLRGLAAGEYRVAIWRDDVGYDFNLAVRAPGPGGPPIELVFEPDRALDLVLQDRGRPVAGVQVVPWDEHRVFGLAAATTGASGRVHWGPVGSGTFVLDLTHPSLWSREARVEATLPGSSTKVEVRLRGHLAFEVSDPSGPLDSCRIELESVEFATDVGQWVEAGQANAFPPDRATDSTGRLRFEGLPNGPFRWRLTHGEEAREGIVTVAPQVVTLERIFIQSR